MGCGYSMPVNVRDEILEIEHTSISQNNRVKYFKKYYNQSPTIYHEQNKQE